jgi:hypothetical protein
MHFMILHDADPNEPKRTCCFSRSHSRTNFLLGLRQGCADIPGWEDVNGYTCGDYASVGSTLSTEGCQGRLYAVNGVSAHEACGASCPELCGESFDPISAAIDLLAFQNMYLLANLGQL